MAVAAFTDHGVFGDPNPFDFGDRMAGETVATAFGHFGRVGAVAFDTGRHRLVAMVAIDVF